MLKELTKRLLTVINATFATLIVVVFFLLLIEVIVSPITKSKVWLNHPIASLNITDRHYDVPPSYTGAAWFEEYRKEFNAAVTFDWQPYLYWHTKPFAGKFINVNEDRTRKTQLSRIKTSHPKKNKKIFMFGGSTMWGWGVRDAYTIPSLVSKNLSDHGINSEVTNFGEIGFVSTQEVLRLLFELQKGNMPDIVIFYDGLNDIYSALRPGQTGVVGVACDEFQRKKLFEGKYPIFRWIFENYILDSGIFKVALRLSKKDKAEPVLLQPEQIEKISRDIIQIYEKNLDFVEALSKKYNFDVLYYWQPTIFSKAILSASESELEKSAKINLFNDAVFKQVNESVQNIKRSTFHNISDILNKNITYYIDFAHIDEKGNGIIAERMSNDLINQMKDSEKNQGSEAIS